MSIQEFKLTTFMNQLSEKNNLKFLGNIIYSDESVCKNLPRTFKSPKLKMSLDNMKIFKSQDINKLSINEEDEYYHKSVRLSISKSSAQIGMVSDEKELTNKLNLLERLIPENLKEIILFTKFKSLNINADLIISHKYSNGEIYLGSNAYQYNVDNLNNFDVIINVIGEDHIRTYDGKQLTLKKKIKDQNIEVINVFLPNGHSVCYYLKIDDNFYNYHYLSDKIQEHFIKGERVFVHCKQGLIRSAMLLTFYLRKYIFKRVEDANEFIGIKRENASCNEIFFQTIEKMVHKTS